MGDAIQTYTRRDFTNAYMQCDVKMFSDIIKTTMKEKGISAKDIRKYGIRIDGYNTNVISRICMPKPERFQLLSDIMFQKDNTIQEATDMNNDTIIDYIIDRTKYKYDYEFCLDFGISLKKLAQIRYCVNISQLVSDPYVIETTNDEWPSMEPIIDAIINGIEMNDLITAIRKAVPKFNDFCCGNETSKWYLTRMDDYLLKKAKMPYAIYDAAMDYIESAPKNKFADLHGYLDTRRTILTALCETRIYDADAKMGKFLENRYSAKTIFWKRDKQKIFTSLMKSYNRKRKDANDVSLTRVFVCFDEICQTIYDYEKDAIINISILIRNLPRTTDRAVAYTQSGHPEKALAIIKTMLSNSPLTCNQIQARAEDYKKQGCLPKSFEGKMLPNACTHYLRRTDIKKENCMSASPQYIEALEIKPSEQEESALSSFLMNLPQYHFERSMFVTAFSSILGSDMCKQVQDLCIETRMTPSFLLINDGDERYVIHLPSGTIINWYKHLGRTNTCNKPGFGLDDLRDMLLSLKEELSEQD